MRIKDFSVAIGFDGDGEAKCLIVANEGLPEGGLRALTASRAYLKDGDLHFEAPSGPLVLASVVPSVRDVLEKRLPVVVLDQAHGVERLVEVVPVPQATLSAGVGGSGTSGGGISLPPGFFG